MAVVFTELDPESGRVVPSPRAEHVDEGDGVCDLCGARLAQGVLWGQRVLKVCRRCAVEDLPGLIAETVVGSAFEIQARTRDRFTLPDPGYHEGVLREIEARFVAAYRYAAREAERVPSAPGVGASIGAPGRRGY